MVFLNKSADAIDFPAIKTATALEPDGFKPKLGTVVIALHMDVSRFVAISGKKMKAVRPSQQYSWHSAITVLYT